MTTTSSEMTSVSGWTTEGPFLPSSGGVRPTMENPHGPTTFVAVQPAAPREVSGWLLGYVLPPVILLVVVTNGAVLAVLCRRHMRTPATCILVVLALCATLASLSVLPWYVYYYTVGHYQHDSSHVSKEWCMVQLYSVQMLPEMLHTAVTWSIVMLSVHRYLYVRHYYVNSGVARCLVSWPVTCVALVVMVGLAVGHSLPRYISSHCDLAGESAAVELGNTTMGVFTPQDGWSAVYRKSWSWFRLLAVQFIPLVIMFVMTCLLVPTVARFKREARRLLVYNKIVEHQAASDGESLNAMTVSVLVLSLVVQTPLTVLVILHVVQRSCETCSIFPDYHLFTLLHLYLTSLVTLSYTLHLPLYCLSSRKFRVTLARMCCRGRAGTGSVSGSGAAGGGGQYTELKTYKEVLESETTVL